MQCHSHCPHRPPPQIVESPTQDGVNAPTRPSLPTPSVPFTDKSLLHRNQQPVEPSPRRLKQRQQSPPLNLSARPSHKQNKHQNDLPHQSIQEDGKPGQRKVRNVPAQHLLVLIIVGNIPVKCKMFPIMIFRKYKKPP